VSLQSIIAKAQIIPRDFGESFRAKVLGDGNSSYFDLPSDNIDPASLVVWIDTETGPPDTLTQVALPPGLGEYSVDPRGGSITTGEAVPMSAVLNVTGIGGLWSTPADLETFVEIAFDLHARGRTPALTYDNVSPAEEYAIALLAVRESLWAEVAEHAHQVDVTTPEGMHIPGGQMYSQLMTLLDRIEAHYREFASVLNVGPWAIEMFTLRRVSRTTNKLVPVYVPQEFDDYSPPVRVYPPINPGF
jgi:hypothetical protein